MKTYITTAKGQSPDFKLRKPGEVFTADFGEVEPSWAVEQKPAKEAPAEKPKPKGRQPADDSDG